MGGPDARARCSGAVEVRLLPSPSVLRGAEPSQHRPHGTAAAALRARGRARGPQRPRTHLQHSHHDGIDYFVTGAGSKLDRGTPDRFADADTVTWSNHAHFLLVRIQQKTMTVRVIGEREGAADGLTDVPRFTPSGIEVSEPIVLQL